MESGIQEISSHQICVQRFINRKNRVPKSSDEGEEDSGGEKKRSYQ